MADKDCERIWQTSDNNHIPQQRSTPTPNAIHTAKEILETQTKNHLPKIGSSSVASTAAAAMNPIGKLIVEKQLQAELDGTSEELPPFEPAIQRVGYAVKTPEIADRLKKVAALIVLAFTMLGVAAAGVAATDDETIKTCQATITNQHSIWENTDVKINTDQGEWFLRNVEKEKNQITKQMISFKSEDSIKYQVIPGPTGISSVNVGDIECQPETIKAPVKQSTTTTMVKTKTSSTAPEKTTTTVEPKREPAKPVKPIVANPTFTG